MASIPTRILLFLSSYSPLLLILSLRTYKDFGRYSLIFAGIAILAVCALALYLWSASKLTTFRLTVESVSSKDAEAMSYIVSYVIPFIDLPFDDWRNTISLLLFVLMLGVIYVNSNMIHINPVLNMMFYHLIAIESGGEVHSLITRKRYIAKGSQIVVHKLGVDVFLEGRR